VVGRSESRGEEMRSSESSLETVVYGVPLIAND